MKNEPCHMMVFRDVQQHLPGKRLHSELLAELQAVYSAENNDLENLLTSVFLRTGELECALTDLAAAEPDSAWRRSAALLSRITDLIAESLLLPERASGNARKAEILLQSVICPETVRISPPEGFCFYALHPLDYVHCLKTLRLQPTQPVMVVGVRSMGTTLSAMVLAELRRSRRDAQGQTRAERITVRPVGHPYDRTTSIPDRDLVLEYNRIAATFLVVDEGPGLSGSSFLSVGDALHALGVPKERIVFMCSRSVDPDSLVATNAASRWRSFTSQVVLPTREKPVEDAIPISGGAWRNLILREPKYARSEYGDPAHWPAVWPQLSPSKYLSNDRKTFFKYEGLGRYGAAVSRRAQIIADAGFTARPTMARNGFTAYPWLDGTLLSAGEVSSGLLRHVAEYLAFRLRNFGCDDTGKEMMEEMTRFNFQNITGRGLNSEFKLNVERPVIADGRMMPYEFLRLEDSGRLLKLDCAAHGDNHFLPGPVDIAWDLAGTIVEWQLDDAAAEYFLDCYERATGDRARARLRPYLLAYSAFQTGYSMMAASALSDESDDRNRLLRDLSRYREQMLRFEADETSKEIQVKSRTGQSLIPPSPVLQT